METFVVASGGKLQILKDPNAILDYTFDWTDWLAAASSPADNLATATFTTTGGGCTVQTQVNDQKKATAWVSGGTPGSTAALQCRITTTGGRTEDRTVYLKIKER